MNTGVEVTTPAVVGVVAKIIPPVHLRIPKIRHAPRCES